MEFNKDDDDDDDDDDETYKVSNTEKGKRVIWLMTGTRGGFW
jgi:hypothetical protein